MKPKVFFPKDWSGNEEFLCGPDCDPFPTAAARPRSRQRCQLGWHCSAFFGTTRWLHSSQVATWSLLIVLGVCRGHHAITTSSLEWYSQALGVGETEAQRHT